ncbi:MAG: metallophosphoesterase family protein [Oscillospiraceae bacterium]|nr:metallophosphoesterase family protein [Oscillospiraceae bacterium]
MKMKYDVNGEFRIMVVGDIHEKPAYDSRKDNARILDYLRHINTAIDKIRPDMAVIMGDIINADTFDKLKTGLDKTLAPFINRNIPFAVVRGNHDGDGQNAWSEYEKILRTYDNCLYVKKETDGYGDYNIPVYSHDGKRMVSNLWMLNSNAHSDEFDGYDYVKPEQIAWYEKTSDALKKKNGGKAVPSLVFQHMPVCEEYRLLKETSALSMVGSAVFDDNEHNKKFYLPDKSTHFKGYLGEAPSSSEYNSGQFESWLKQGDVMGAFFAHDHINDFIGAVDGIWLGQCKSAGFGMYGDGLRQGVRVIRLKEAQPDRFFTEMRTYREMIGMDCESIHGRVKYVHDKLGVKIDLAERVLTVAAVAAGIGAGIYKLSKIMKSK